jgi:hypothetical protein
LQSKILLDVGFNVIAVEPVEKFCNIMKENLVSKYGKRITIIPKGVGEEESVKTLFLQEATMSTFSEEFINDRKENIDCGDIWQDKIDVEGYELNVLKGLTKPVKYISIEHIPTMREKTIQCLNRLMDISYDYKFNYLLGKSILLVLKDWISYDELIKIIQDDNDSLNTIAYSDIFAKKCG